MQRHALQKLIEELERGLQPKLAEPGDAQNPVADDCLAARAHAKRRCWRARGHARAAILNPDQDAGLAEGTANEGWIVVEAQKSSRVQMNPIRQPQTIERPQT